MRLWNFKSFLIRERVLFLISWCKRLAEAVTAAMAIGSSDSSRNSSCVQRLFDSISLRSYTFQFRFIHCELWGDGSEACLGPWFMFPFAENKLNVLIFISKSDLLRTREKGMYEHIKWIECRAFCAHMQTQFCTLHNNGVNEKSKTVYNF